MHAPTSPLRRASWAWPLLLAVGFAASVALWLRYSDARDLEDERLTLISDALTLEARLSDWIGAEQAGVARLAQQLPAHVDGAQLLRQPQVAEGLRRLWISVTVVDALGRVRAHVPEQVPRLAPPPSLPGAVSLDEGGLSAHWSADMPEGARLVVRFAPTALLRLALPWWLGQKYDVRLVDELGTRVAQIGDPNTRPGGQSYRVSVAPAMRETWLELATRKRHAPWWQSLAAGLMAVFVLLSALASAMLRRQMREVRRAETEARTEAAWRRAIENSLTVGLRGRDLQGRITHVNRAFCDLVGLDEGELLGRQPPMPYWQPDDMADSLRRHRRNMAGGAPRDGYEARWRHRDGHAIDVMIFESPLVDASGRQVGWMGSIVDISARKRAEERERRQTEALAHQARLGMLGEVASALAHQLNQPLAAIAGYNGGALRLLEGNASADPMVRQALERIAEQAAQAGRIVQRIRAFLTRRAPQPEACRVDELVQRVLTLLRRELLNLPVEVAVPAGLPHVLADAVLIEQVLINLLRNALDAMRESGIRAPRLRIAATAVGRFVRVDVDDSGPGLQGLGIDALSAPFYSTKAEGMGMGLAICRSVVEAHLGGMEAATSALGGARLSFTLPQETAP